MASSSAMTTRVGTVALQCSSLVRWWRRAGRAGRLGRVRVAGPRRGGRHGGGAWHRRGARPRGAPARRAASRRPALAGGLRRPPPARWASCSSATARSRVTAFMRSDTSFRRRSIKVRPTTASLGTAPSLADPPVRTSPSDSGRSDGSHVDHRPPGGRGADPGWGIQPGYHDVWGQWKTPSRPSRRPGHPPGHGSADRRSRRGCPQRYPTSHRSPGRTGAVGDITGPATLLLEDGAEIRAATAAGSRPTSPSGYHRLEADTGRSRPAGRARDRRAPTCPPRRRTCACGASPPSCTRLGPAPAGASATSATSAASSAGPPSGGRGMVGLNPLHASAPVGPPANSPYSPSSRRWRDPIYLDVAQLPASHRRRRRRRRCWRRAPPSTRTTASIATAVWTLKRSVLEAVWTRSRSGPGVRPLPRRARRRPHPVGHLLRPAERPRPELARLARRSSGTRTPSGVGRFADAHGRPDRRSGAGSSSSRAAVRRQLAPRPSW